MVHFSQCNIYFGLPWKLKAFLLCKTIGQSLLSIHSLYLLLHNIPKLFKFRKGFRTWIPSKIFSWPLLRSLVEHVFFRKVLKFGSEKVAARLNITFQNLWNYWSDSRAMSKPTHYIISLCHYDLVSLIMRFENYKGMRFQMKLNQWIAWSVF